MGVGSIFSPENNMFFFQKLKKSTPLHTPEPGECHRKTAIAMPPQCHRKKETKKIKISFFWEPYTASQCTTEWHPPPGTLPPVFTTSQGAGKWRVKQKKRSKRKTEK